MTTHRRVRRIGSVNQRVVLRGLFLGVLLLSSCSGHGIGVDIEKAQPDGSRRTHNNILNKRGIIEARSHNSPLHSLRGTMLNSASKFVVMGQIAGENERVEDRHLKLKHTTKHHTSSEVAKPPLGTDTEENQEVELNAPEEETAPVVEPPSSEETGTEGASSIEGDEEELTDPTYENAAIDDAMSSGEWLTEPAEEVILALAEWQDRVTRGEW